jgi:hypothetical protein
MVTGRRDGPGRDGPLSTAEVGRTTDLHPPGRVSPYHPRRYLGDGGERYLEDILRDGKPGKNRVIAKVIPEHMSGWGFRKLPGAGGASTA